MSRLAELREEFSSVFSGRAAGTLDALTPAIAFVIGNSIFDIRSAVWMALILSAFLAILRLLRGNRPLFALLGLAATLISALLIYRLDAEIAFFLPGAATSAILVGLIILSLLLSHPLAAWSSFLARRWPLDWYGHPRVLPAYREVTLIWLLAFGGRLFFESRLLIANDFASLGNFRLFIGWPFTLSVLVISYLYGNRRLQKLEGPSVEEFVERRPAPWKSQAKGF